MVRVLAATIVAAALSGCAYRPLKAPCSADEGGVPIAYSSLDATGSGEPAGAQDTCGPMRPI